jgi:hypothetical protein
VRREVTRVDHASRRRAGGVAVCGAYAAWRAGASDRRAYELGRGRCGRSGPHRGVPAGVQQLGGTDSGNVRIDYRWAAGPPKGMSAARVPLFRRRRCQNAVASRIVHAPLTFLVKTDIFAMDGIIS